ncbi:TIGR03936 family radical SAM-associated protein [Candidatus Formimonas warabiya]|uniref:DUF2344 domain-containing protein n=1 Tax=Formimonas warabiya TaxID=1761012 RepID=A0A3G1KSS8_FORW1|nr:TIGR03936 family radical SAM-associated protein [Candidatus Formimonas warabiya]ATW25486.1 hypothetical protein DCMF_12500 [Candidatus Formimonas warabiya]
MILLRSCFEVTGRIRFLSHLDLLKVLERALRRADLPVAFSQGFNPHPKIAFGSARAVGLASECEYFDVELDRYVPPADFRQRLQEQCPCGLVIKETREISPASPPLMAVINCASYRVMVQSPFPFTQEELDQKMDRLFDKKEIVVERVSPKGRKTYDIRPGIFSLTAQALPEGALFHMDVAVGNEGNVRPGEVITALALEGEMGAITRTGLFIRNVGGEKVAPW